MYFAFVNFLKQGEGRLAGGIRFPPARISPGEVCRPVQSSPRLTYLRRKGVHAGKFPFTGDTETRLLYTIQTLLEYASTRYMIKPEPSVRMLGRDTTSRTQKKHKNYETKFHNGGWSSVSCWDVWLRKYRIIHHYVNPFVGKQGHGHTYPGAIVPNGMIQPSPDTRIYQWDACSGYYYADSTINGFSHTHLSGTGCGDYGDVLLTHS